MNHPPKIGCLIMAAGNASRFGSNKLAAKVDGKMLIEHALETVPREEFARVIVVTQYDEVLVLARRFGFTVLVNPSRVGREPHRQARHRGDGRL